MALSPAAFQVQYDLEAASLNAENPVFRLITPSVARIRWAYAYYDTRRALLRAAVAVQAEGMAALDRHTDPYDDSAFVHVGSTRGFTLQSRLTQDKTPLSIRVGSSAH